MIRENRQNEGHLSSQQGAALPAGAARATILPLTYAVVVFSILIQGTTMPTLTWIQLSSATP